MGFGGFFILKIVVLFLMRGWSHIFTIGQININSQNFNILSSQDTSNTKSSIKHKNFNVSYTRYMARIQVA
jgi:hypothetical protein